MLVHPQIPQNAGSVARTCAATSVALHLVKPLGFDIDSRKCVPHTRQTAEHRMSCAFGFMNLSLIFDEVIQVEASWTGLLAFCRGQSA